MEYLPTGAVNQSTCFDFLNASYSTDTEPPFSEGCFCIEGFYFDGESCVEEDDCGCIYEDQYYKVKFYRLYLLLSSILTVCFILYQATKFLCPRIDSGTYSFCLVCFSVVNLSVYIFVCLNANAFYFFHTVFFPIKDNSFP